MTIPPPTLKITTTPSDITIRQGEDQLVAARVKSTAGFSNDVINITLGITGSNFSNSNINSNMNYNTLPSFNPDELNVDIIKNQPPLFKIHVPPQTPLGIYTIPLIVTIREPQ